MQNVSLESCLKKYASTLLVDSKNTLITINEQIYLIFPKCFSNLKSTEWVFKTEYAGGTGYLWTIQDFRVSLFKCVILKEYTQNTKKKKQQNILTPSGIIYWLFPEKNLQLNKIHSVWRLSSVWFKTPSDNSTLLHSFLVKSVSCGFSMRAANYTVYTHTVVKASVFIPVQKLQNRIL